MTLILLPGTGADHRLFEPQQEAFPDLAVPAWIEAKKQEGLPEYAARLAGTVALSRPLVLGGVSLGGMIAYEMARHLRPDVLVLIASCRTRAGIRRMFRALRPIVRILPAGSVPLFKAVAPLAVARFQRLTPAQRRTCVAMFKDTDARFLKWALGAILAWNPQPLEGVRVLHIHGQRDPVIPAKAVQADELIPGGGHLINLTHSEQVNAFIRNAIRTIQ
jgi:pimeloyl-ACP methyl ester carboxylesterase